VTNDTTASNALPFARVYGGPLEEFVPRRDTLAKELRSAGERDTASAVKALRKPSRLAWALDQGAIAAPGALDALVTAVAETVDAQTRSGDVRSAMTNLRTAVREFAEQAAAAADAAGHRVESGTLVNAILAVLGRPDSFDALRAGRLVDVPDAGGLDFLSTLPMPAPSGAPAPQKPQLSNRRRTDPKQEARAAVDAATSALDEARRRLDTARSHLEDALSQSADADARLRTAEADARAARQRADHARQHAEEADAAVRNAEQVLRKARDHLVQEQ